MKPNVCSCASSFSSVQCDSCSARGIAPRPPYGSSSRSSCAITSAADAPRRRAQRDVVEAALHVERRGQRAADPSRRCRTAGRRERSRRADGVDVLGRQRDADDREPAEPAVDHGADASPGARPCARDERLAGEHLVGRAGLDPAAGAQKRRSTARPPRPGIEMRRPVAGSSMPGDVERDVRDDARLDRPTPGMAAISAADA